jgi:hypothetical protein
MLRIQQEVSSAFVLLTSPVACYGTIRWGRSLTLSPTNNMHTYSIVIPLLYIVYYTSHIYIQPLSIITEQT